MPERIYDLVAAEAEREARTLSQQVAEVLRDRYRGEMYDR